MSNPIRAIAHVADATAECITELLKAHGITAEIDITIKVEEGKVEAFKQMMYTNFTLETRLDKAIMKPVQVIKTKNMKFVTCVSSEDIDTCIADADIKVEEVADAEPTELHKEEKQSKTLIQIFDADDFPNVLNKA